MYHISYKHATHGSDTLGIDFKTPQAAAAFIEKLQDDPLQFGMVDWLRDASLWVTDDVGNIY